MTARSWNVAGTSAVLLFAASLVSAHHSVLGQFDPDARIELNGVISKVDFINPHIYLLLDVEEESGDTSVWRLESVPPAYLYKAQVTPEMLMGGGQPVRIEAVRARDETRQLGFIIRIHYPEGHHYQLSEDF